MKWARWAVLALGGLAVLLTLLPILPSNEWWIRIWDFPRLQLAAVLLAVLLLSLILLSLQRALSWAFLAVLALALAWQTHLMWPYSPFAEVQAAATESCDADDRLQLLSANVEVSNRDVEPLLRLVRDLEPDLLLLIETDEWWQEQLAPLIEAFPENLGHFADDGHGMVLLSRLPLVDPQIRFLLDDYVASIKTGVRLRSGNEITLYGLHPKPPPLQDTAQRDAELLIVAREMRESEADEIVAGDLNDVGWSRTTRLFLETSGALDPRIGRGPFSTFNAAWPALMRWPLDYVFIEPSFVLRDMTLLDSIGSDHLPLLVDLCHRRGAPPPDQQGLVPSASEKQRASEIIEEGREAAEE